jgi:hypothetical protein
MCLEDTPTLAVWRAGLTTTRPVIAAAIHAADMMAGPQINVTGIQSYVFAAF